MKVTQENKIESNSNTPEMVDWKELFGEETFMTDLGEAQSEIRYAVWVYKDEKHHVVRVGKDREILQKKFKIRDEMVIKFNTEDVEKITQIEAKNKRLKAWNSGSRSSAKDQDKTKNITKSIRDSRDNDSRRSRL